MATPYYNDLIEQMKQTQTQRRALGSGREFDPDTITRIMGENFKQQQQATTTQEIFQSNVTFRDTQANEAKHQAARAAENQGIMGTAQLALTAPVALYAGKALLGGTTAGAETGVAGPGMGYITGAGGTTAGAETGVAASGADLSTTALTEAAGYGSSEAAITGGGVGATGGGVGATAGAEAGASTVGAGTVIGAGILGVGAMAASAAGTNWAARELNLPGKADYWGVAGAVAGATLAGILIPLAIAKDIFDGGSLVPEFHGGSIICTELNRQGLLEDSQLRASSAYVRKHQHEPGNREFYMGYLILATPIVERMKKSKLITYLMQPYGSIICRECASRVSNKYKSTFFSRLVYSISGIVFRKIYANTLSRRMDYVIN